MIDGARLGSLFREAQSDLKLRIQIYYCPDRLAEQWNLSEAESDALQMADLSQIDLDDETLQLGRRLFSQVPTGESGLASEVSVSTVFGSRPKEDPCL